MASIRKRGDYQWEVRIRRKGHPVTCKTFETRSDAERWAREIESEMDRGIYISRSEAESTTLAEALDRYIEEHIPRLSQTNTSKYLAVALKKRAMASKSLATIRSKDIADFVREREAEGVSGASIRNTLALLSKLFNLAIRDWGMESLRNPVALVSKPKAGKGRERRLEAGEENRLLTATAPEMRNIIRLALETAMRRGELANLGWNDIDLKRKSAVLYETKNGETRSIPLSPKALEILRSIQAEQGEEGQKQQEKRETGGGKGVVFPSFAGNPEKITREMREACGKAGIEGLRFHDLRHEATSRLFENTDLDLMEIRAITGHKTLQMLVRYTHLRTARLADRLAGARKQGS
ncbi:MAG: tyrosine-type recombinase/integrase [Candidatus Peribacteria bacterium]|jgi:integrase|nr:tyrosine-type recombinase/integrase [Candidatus Peribacteria bacterium]